MSLVGIYDCIQATGARLIERLARRVVIVRLLATELR